MIMADGRVVYTRWEHHGQVNRFPLFFTHPDGHGTFTFFSPHSAGMFFHAREMPDGSVVAIRSSMVNGDSGPVVFIKDFSTAGEPLLDGALENIAPEVELRDPYEKGAFKYPFPLPDGRLIVSYSPRYGTWVDENDNIIEEIEPDYGLYTMNVDGGGLTLLYNDLDSQEYDAVVIADRPMPPVIPSTLDRSSNNGVFTVENVYFRQTGDGQEIPNKDIREAKQVMVIEGLPRMRGDRGEIGETEFEQKRIVGVAPIESDGSFSIRVQANTPLSFNVLDSLGRAIVAKRNWVTARPGEQFEKCSGCHSPRGQSSGNPNPIAGNRPPSDLTVPVAERDVSFVYALEPIIEAKCQGCHSGMNPPGDLELTITKDPEEPLFSIAYTSLVGDMDEETEGRQNDYVQEPFSRRSLLIDILLGLGNTPFPTRHPSDAFSLSDAELQKFINWVDLGAQYR
jgi:mono/diheme cytochrome c family protein